MKYITRVYEQDSRKHTKNCETTQDRRKRAKKSSGGGYTDLSTMQAQYNTMAKIPLKNKQTSNNKGQEWKTGHAMGRGRVKGRR
jgi:hypothetical protein